jgi:hypothetical protein
MIKLILLATFCLILLVNLALADDLTTLNGTTYKNITVVKKDLYSITVLTDDGGATILFTNLPPDMQKKYGYDPVAAQIKTQAVAEALANQQAQVQASKEANALSALNIRTKYDPLANQTSVSIVVSGAPERRHSGIPDSYHDQSKRCVVSLNWINQGKTVLQPESTVLTFATFYSYIGTSVHLNADEVATLIPIIDLNSQIGVFYTKYDTYLNLCGVNITKTGIESLIQSKSGFITLSGTEGETQIELSSAFKEKLRVIMKYINSLSDSAGQLPNLPPASPAVTDAATNISTSDDTSPIAQRHEWQQRLQMLSSNLETLKGQGGSFVTSKNITYSWKDITEVTPKGLSYMTDSGAGKISFQDLPPDLAAKLTLSAAECDKWNSEEAQRQNRLNQIVSNIKKKKAAEQDAIDQKARAASDEYYRKLNAQIAADLKADQEKRDAEKATTAADATARATAQAQQAAQAQQTAQLQQLAQAARQAKAASIAALQSQIDSLHAQEKFAGEVQRNQMEMQIGVLDTKLNDLKNSNP